MNKAIVFSGIVVGTSLLASCSILQQSDPFADFLNQHSLAYREVRWTTNAGEYHVTFQLASTEDTNCVMEGWMTLEDLRKRAEERKAWDKRREEERQNICTNANLRLRLFCSKGDRGWITGAKALDSQRMRDHFPDCRLYSVHAMAGSGNPLFIGQPLVIGTNWINDVLSSVYVLGNPPTVAAFMNQYKQKVDSLEEARRLVSLFAELQDWEICKQIPKGLSQWEKVRGPDWKSRWNYVEEKNASGWRFFTVFQTDPDIKNHWQYQIDVLRDGTISVKELMHMGRVGNYI